MNAEILISNVVNSILKNRCLACNVCCRFPEKYSPLIPFFLNDEIKDGKYFPRIGTFYGCRINTVKTPSGYACPYFNVSHNSCNIYESRPLDCKLYPFMITYDPSYTKAILALDANCPYAKELACLKEEVKKYIDTIQISAQDLGFINDPQPDIIFLCELPHLTKFIFGSSGRLKKLSLKDKEVFDGFTTDYAGDSFIVLYLWKDIMNILWQTENNSLITVHGTNDSLIQIPSSQKEYIYKREELIELKGDKYKDKRNLCNYFEKNYRFDIEALEPDENSIDVLISLYEKWAKDKMQKNKGTYYMQLTEDSLFFHKRALLDFKNLDLTGILLNINDALAGYTFGFPLNKNTFCILAETADTQYKGINQFIFREFCRIIPENYQYINTMDDAEIETLHKNKLSYRPLAVK